MEEKFPALFVNTDAICTNARVLCNVCGSYGISVAGVIKFSDGSVPIGRAYADGGCAQLAVSRAAHLPELKKQIPEKELLLTRAPGRSDLELAARFADLILHADADGLRALNDEAKKWNTAPGVILMLDVGDLREGVETVSELVELALLCEALPNLRLKGVGTNHACLNGVLPSYENLSFLVEGAEAVEKAIGRKLEWISGGSSINLLLLHEGENKMPPRINHLRLGGSIANPMNIRLGRGVTFDGLREDSVSLGAEIIEIREKASAVSGSTKNWMGRTVEQEDKGRRLRAILAVGSQDIASAQDLIPLDEGVTVVGCSSDHTIVDVTDARTLKSGDVLRFRVRYANMLYAFSGKHVNVIYQKD
ncbi:MAG: alanine racemase [Clostridia bacterium]|nr:alanine racemase [Clostridia bacterium]